MPHSAGTACLRRFGLSNRRRISRREIDGDKQEHWPDNISPLLQRVLSSRGLSPEVLDCSLRRMIPVSKLENTDSAAERLMQARERQEKVLVLGDFDADGATATALVMSCLRAYGFRHCDFLVPDRQRFGYGLSAEIVDFAAASGPDLIVTVDNGISSHAGVAAASQADMDVLITDHHLPGETLPAARVIVNPNLPDSRFGSKALAGVGVAFYVMAALGQRLVSEGLLANDEVRNICASCLDLVALGTVADLVPLDYNNRILVTQGLQRMRSDSCRPGIVALFSVANRNRRDCTTADLGFAIAPRLNAAGRLTDMTVGINCLLADSDEEAQLLASELSRLNEQRKEVQASMQAEAEGLINELEAGLGQAISDAICLYEPDWHQGIVGLVATRIRERINRPVIAFAPDESGSTLKGSGRSVSGVHMRDVLAGIDARYPGLIDKFGGHAMAAGLSLPADKLDIFKAAFAEEVLRYADQIDEVDHIWSDGELTTEDFSLQTAEKLRYAAPWGQGCPEPVFDGRFEIVDKRIVGGNHLKLKVRPVGSEQTVDGICFNQTELPAGKILTEYRLAFKLDVNEFRNQRTHQLVVEHIECV